MKKEDFIVGKWYVSSIWTTFIATKFSGFNKYGYYIYSESIHNDKRRHRFNSSYTTSDEQDWFPKSVMGIYKKEGANMVNK